LKSRRTAAGRFLIDSELGQQSRFADTAAWQRLLGLWETSILACRQLLPAPLQHVA